MAGIFSGLESLGLGNLAGAELFEKEKPKEEEQKGPVIPEEKEFIFDKTVECPICEKKFTTKIMKSGKAKLLGTDLDLRTKYEGLDATKYDAVRCSHCGFSALTRYFVRLTPTQTKMIKENICSRVKITESGDETYSYEEAIERYKLTLACAVVKQAKASEKAYICLKSAWLLRGYAEKLEADGELSAAKKAELKAEEMEYLKNAYEGFAAARASENFPVAGMDEMTVDYLLAVLAYEIGNMQVASNMISRILTAPNAGQRMKDKARDLKDLIVEKIKSEK